jgi:hypothetical protein
VEGPIRIRGLGDMASEISAAQSVRNQNRLSSNADLEILSSFPKKEMNTKVEDNFVAHNLDTEFALFGVRTWEILSLPLGRVWINPLLLIPKSK